MRYQTFITVAFALVVTSCETELDVAIVNNASGEITVSIGDRETKVPAGGAVQRPYPQDHGVPGQVHIAVSNCVLTFAMPRDIEAYPWWSQLRGVAMQLEPDLKLYEVPPDTREPIVVAGVISRQQPGFPLAPAESECR